MGLRDDVWGIKRSIDQQAQSSNSKSMNKYKTESDLMVKLEYFIRKYKENARDIYNVNVQDEIIQKTLRSVFGSLLNDADVTDPKQFVENYKTQDERIDENYYYLYCMRHYLTACRNVEHYIKKQESSNIKNDTIKNQEQEQLRTEILRLKKQQEEEKLRKLRTEKPVNRVTSKPVQRIKVINRSSRRYTGSNAAGEIIKVMMYLMFAPLAIMGLMLFGFLNAAAKSK